MTAGPRRCPACGVRRPPPEPVVEDQSMNGVKVLVHRWPDGNTAVEADCSCFGTSFRCHNSTACPVYLAATPRRKR